MPLNCQIFLRYFAYNVTNPDIFLLYNFNKSKCMHKLSKITLRNICYKTFYVIKLFLTKFRGDTSTKGIGMQTFWLIRIFYEYHQQEPYGPKQVIIYLIRDGNPPRVQAVKGGQKQYIILLTPTKFITEIAVTIVIDVIIIIINIPWW